MYKYNLKKRKRHALKTWILLAAATIILFVGGVWTLHAWYNHNLSPVSTSHKTVFFTVNSGDSKHTIALNLKKAGLIRNTGAFETYLRGNEVRILQAGTYILTPSMDTKQIVHALAVGDVAKNLLTILPGKRLDQIKQTFVKAGYSQTEVDKAFDPTQYADEPALDSLPFGSSLEGYLYPDSFQKLTNTPAQTIVRESLQEMKSHLTEDIQAGFVKQGLNVFQGITLASIVAQESGDSASQPTIAQVFLLRLKQGMPLQSDVTAFYASDMAGQPRDTNIVSSYNTYKQAGLPPGPISNITASALHAVAHPSNTDYLYFIAGDNGDMHFSHTQEEHQAAIDQFCVKLCAH